MEYSFDSPSEVSNGETDSDFVHNLTGSGLAELEDVSEIAESGNFDEDKKKELLQKALFNGSSNGDVKKVKTLLSGANISRYVDVNAKDDKGSTALIYSSCFGHEPVVSELLKFGALTDEQDNHEWTALMWAINNKHLGIVRSLMENGADLNISTSSGRTAMDFAHPHDEIYNYLKSSGYIEEDDKDFYTEMRDPTVLEDEFNKKLEESAGYLDSDMGNLSLGGSIAAATSLVKPVGYGVFNDVDVRPESEDDTDEDVADIEDYTYGDEGFVWDRCLPDQMFVFNESDIPKILDLSISEISPQRSGRQKPIPANMIFLCARYAHYFSSPEMLSNLLEPVVTRIRSAIVDHKTDIAFLSFWLSNSSLLLYYFRKDLNLSAVTKEFQNSVGQIVGDIYVLITQDAEVRLDKILDASILDYETIPGLNEIAYQSDWTIFKRKTKPMTHKEEVAQVTRPPSPKRKARPSSRMVTSILSSVLFMLDLYGVHPIITQQVISQILYWLGASLFNRVMSNKKYLARSRAMQIRLNVSAIEDWARSNNRRPKDANEFSDLSLTNTNLCYMSTVDLCREHFASLTQILQWLQCFTGFGDDFTNVISTLQQLTALNPMQLLHVANKYRVEVGELGLSKEYKKYLADLQQSYDKQHVHIATVDKEPKPKKDNSKDTEKGQETELEKKEENTEGASFSEPAREPVSLTIARRRSSEDAPRQQLYLDAAKVLPFVLPTQQEMVITWGAGLGGTHIKRARKHEPVLPADFLDKFESDKDHEGAIGISSKLSSDDTSGVSGVNAGIFSTLAAPEPSVHKGWGEDPEIDDLNGGWSTL